MPASPSRGGDAPLAYSQSQIAELTGLSRRSIERAIASGQLRSRRIGSRRIVLAADAQHWLRHDHPAPLGGGAQ